MATVLTIDRDALIERALTRLGVIALGETISAAAEVDAEVVLEFVLKSIEQDPKLAHNIAPTAKTVATVSGTRTVTLDATAISVEGATYNDGTTEYELTQMDLPRLISATASGDANADPEFYYVTKNTQDAQLTMYLHPIPDANGTVTYWSKDRITIPDSDTDVLDVPDAWFKLILYSLTLELAWEYRRDLQEIQLHKALYEQEYNKLLEFDTQELPQHRVTPER